MSRRKTVALLCGGKSPEHRISLISAQNIIKSIDSDRFDLMPIGISTEGDWYYYPNGLKLLAPSDPNKVSLEPSDHRVSLSVNPSDQCLFSLTNPGEKFPIDLIYPILHGNHGEDGSIQGLSKLANLPCVGCGINGSAISMDKDVMKKVLRDAQIDVAKSITLRPFTKVNWNYKTMAKELSATMYIKPATLGSSIGVSRVKNEDEFEKAIDLAFKYDDKLLVEEEIIGREIECAVLGNDEPKPSCIGEISAQNDFYTFDNKYVNADGAKLAIPAELPEKVSEAAKTLAVEAYKVMDCCGLSRVDMFYTAEGRLLINEVNTIPGFTNISMYPKLWEQEGLSQKNLISRLIDLALERHQKESNFRHNA